MMQGNPRSSLSDVCWPEECLGKECGMEVAESMQIHYRGLKNVATESTFLLFMVGQQ